MNPYLLILFLYSILLIGLGAAISRRVKSPEDFYVAGRRLGPGLLFSTLLAANIGAGSTIGAAGLGFAMGLVGWWWVGSAGVGSLILAFVIGPSIWRISKRHGFFTLGDFLEFRYDRSVRICVASLLWLGSLAILAGQLIAFARILEVVAGTPKSLGCLLGGIVVVAYFSASGLKGAAWINLLQLIVKGFGFLLAVPFAMAAVGGWGAMREAILARPEVASHYFSLTGSGWEQALPYLILLAPAFIVSPGLIQKIYGARDEFAVRSGTSLNAVALLGFAIIPVILGMAAAAMFPNLSHPELALPVVMTELLPFWLGATLLASVFSAELSSADAILFMLSTSLSRDLYQTLMNASVSQSRLLTMSRRISVLAGSLGVLLSILLPSVIGALTLFYGLLSVALFVPFIAGLYSSRLSARHALAAILLSVPGASVFHLITGGGVGPVSSTAFGIFVSFLVISPSLFRGAFRK